MSVVNDVGCAIDRKRGLNLGDIIEVEHKLMSRRNEYVVRLIGYSHYPQEAPPKLSLKFSNQDNFKRLDDFYKDVEKKALSSASRIITNSKTWNNAQQNAVDTILNNAFDAARTDILTADNMIVTFGNRGINCKSALKAMEGQETQILNNLISMTTNSWQTVDTVIRPGEIFAKFLTGIMMISKNLKIVSPTKDGTSSSFTMDENGFEILNNCFKLGGFTDVNGNIIDVQNGILMDEEGMKVTNNEKTFRIEINAYTGIKFNKLRDGGNTVEDTVFWIKPNGDLVTKGVGYFKDIFLYRLDGSSVADSILKANDKGNNSIDGNYIDAKGIRVKKGSTTTFEVTNDGDLYGRNGNFTGSITSGGTISGAVLKGNKIFTGNPTQPQIDDVPDGTIHGGIFVGGKMIAYSDVQPTLSEIEAIPDGTIQGVTLKGVSLETEENVTVGKTITLNNGNVAGGTISIFNGDFPMLSIVSKGSRPIYISNGSSNIELYGEGVNIDATYATVNYRKIATLDDLNILQDQINALYGETSRLQQQITDLKP